MIVFKAKKVTLEREETDLIRCKNGSLIKNLAVKERSRAFARGN